MALTPEEQKELDMLEALEAQEQEAVSGLSLEEEEELAMLEAMEAEESAQVMSPNGKIVKPGQTHYTDPTTGRTVPLPKNLQDTTPQPIDSGVLGALEGASFGFADEIGGGVKTAAGVLSGEVPFSEVSEQYNKNRNLLREEFKNAKAQNPNSYLTGEIMGGVSTTLIPGIGAAAQSVKGAVGIGAAGGALSGAGRSEEEDPQDILIDSLLGGAVGGGFGAAGYGTGKLLQKGGEKLGKFLNKEGSKELMRALGFSSKTAKGNLNRLVKSKGISKAEMLDEIVDEVAPDGSKIFSPMRSIDDQFEALEETVDAYGKTVGRAVSIVDDYNAKPTIDPTDFRANLLSDLDDMVNSDSAAIAKTSKKFIDDLINPEQMQQPWNLKRLWSFRQKIDQATNFKTDGAIENQIKRRARTSLEKYLRQQMDAAPNVVADAVEGYSLAASKYSKLRTTQDAFYDNIVMKEEGIIGALRKTVHFSGLGLGGAAGFAVAGTPGMLVGATLGRAAQKGIGGKVLGQTLIKAGAAASKNTQYSQKLIQAAGRSAQAFEQALSIGEAMHDFTINKLPRSTEAVKKDFTKLYAVLNDVDPDLGKALQEAVANDDDAAIQGLMSQVALDPIASKYIEPGIGWDGKAVTDGDIKDTEAMIKGSQASSIQKAQLMAQFKSDRVIPQVQEEKPFYKIYDPALKTKVMK